MSGSNMWTEKDKQSSSFRFHLKIREIWTKFWIISIKNSIYKVSIFLQTWKWAVSKNINKYLAFFNHLWIANNSQVVIKSIDHTLFYYP